MSFMSACTMLPRPTSTRSPGTRSRSMATAAELANQKDLKAALQAESSSGKLENLAASLLGRLLGLPIAVAKSGFQHGGDAGAAGQQGRRFRVECKK